ncbi:hypothetical protein IMG5_055580 [Ichthyophthirius multifiliis]|uniref:phosphatidate cytidylyltransferase n=1 Tax=Ichthyophthirius multifiliis TaxID=5932 RepID=G0QN59_ICHMU|nr:hypothetical protein IMG5_055580 [Ichthyophthirius multifiliis]EGR33348.1 hypothetical protein IMG5_055580 [Ichthyophthirius multifiliis]|eukprot:XP_004037334.1 hypothetical protein IMG5_055580 [Ichthyophthirius multifiliis]
MQQIFINLFHFCYGYQDFYYLLQHQKKDVIDINLGKNKQQIQEIKIYRLFALIHLALLLVIAQTSVIVMNILDGIVWFILPILLITTNNIFTFLFSKLFGKTTFIRTCPGKTLEGFILGFLCTLIGSFIISYGLQQHQQLLCSNINNLNIQPFLFNKCEINLIFQIQPYKTHYLIQYFFNINEIYISKFQIHSVVLSAFGSLIAPFGGFFTLGFTKALKIKEYGETQNIYNGISNNIDCFLLMVIFIIIYYIFFINKGTFTYIYLHQVVFSQKFFDTIQLFKIINQLTVEDQLKIYNELKILLQQKNILQQQ